MTANIKNMPGLAELIAKECGIVDKAPRLTEILRQWWPECYKSEFSGKVIMAPQAVVNLEKLFTMFGVPMLVAENSLEVLGHAYDVFSLGLEPFVSNKLQFPDEDFDDYLHDWPKEWVRYVEAVAAEDLAEARRLAHQLQVLSPDCGYPPGLFIQPSKKPGETALAGTAPQ